jgi:alpha-tubulin suppressor-like RCC1 family protein
VAADGDAYCWGEAGNGQLGNGTTLDRLTPTPVNGDREYLQLAAGSAHTCGISDEGRAFCWGEGQGGRLGTGNEDDRTSPQAVVSTLTYVQISAGFAHTCARTGAVAAPTEPGGDADPFCWGVGGDGRLGNGTTNSPQLTPLRVVN